MQTLKTKSGFPNTHQGSTICPFCGGVNGDIEGVHSGHFHGATIAHMRFSCMNGCYWELKLDSDDGEISAAQCLLLELDTDLLSMSFWGSITDWVRLQENLVSDEPA